MKCYEWLGTKAPHYIKYAIFDDNNKFVAGLKYNGERDYSDYPDYNTRDYYKLKRLSKEEFERIAMEFL